MTAPFSPTQESLPIPDIADRLKFEFAITSFTEEQSILNLPAEPFWLSRPVDVTSFPIPDGTQDVLYFQSFPFLEPGETFRVRSAMLNPSIQELRAAGQDYPEWVDRYLQLPDDFSPRVRNYAAQITYGSTNPYEIAQTITTVLRAQIDYSANLTLPPNGTDLMEWFLLVSKRGYCNYFATAEVLMLRSRGVPARLAVGFSQGEVVESIRRPGETEATERVYNIYRKNMHAWPEVYFPGIGWVEFEPTTNQDPLIRPATPFAGLPPVIPPESGPVPEEPPLVPPVGIDETPSTMFQFRPWQSALLWGLLILILGVGYYLADRRFGLTTRMAEYVLVASERRTGHSLTWLRNAALFVLADPFERAFHAINLNLRWLGQPPEPHHTPAERARTLKDIMPASTNEIDVLLKEYHASQYSPDGGDFVQARRAGWRLFWSGLRTFIEHIG
jgi:transglutaminase-like putative cysteine protease